MRGCEWLDGRMDGKVVGRVVGGWWRMVGGWWEGDRRIVGGVVVAVGFLSCCNRDLRDRLVLPQRSQVSFRVVRGLSRFRSSDCW